MIKHSFSALFIKHPFKNKLDKNKRINRDIDFEDEHQNCSMKHVLTHVHCALMLLKL